LLSNAKNPKTRPLVGKCNEIPRSKQAPWKVETPRNFSDLDPAGIIYIYIFCLLFSSIH
jgi:hypothetical protein